MIRIIGENPKDLKINRGTLDYELININKHKILKKPVRVVNKKTTVYKIFYYSKL
jgi:hypothetical protein